MSDRSDSGADAEPVYNADRLPVARRPAHRPPECSACEKCAGRELSSVPAFSAGSGIGARPFAEDVICHRCGHIGPPHYLLDASSV